MATLKKMIKSAPRMRNSVPNGPLVKKKGEFKGSTLKKGGVVKAQNGTSKTKTVLRSPDNMYKTVIKSKSGPGVEKSVIRETRTLKGLLKGAPRVPKLERRKEAPLMNQEPQKPNIAKNGSKLKSKTKNKK